MDYIRIKNLRSLADTKPVHLKPITVLLGQNSSGKSTFLRTFPLFRQSAESRTLGPILWYGNLVDFGNFNEAVNRFTSDKTITFEFKFNIDLRNTSVRRRPERNFIDDSIEVIFSLALEQTSKQEVARLRSLTSEYLGHTIFIEFDNRGRVKIFKINKSDFSNISQEIEPTQRNGLLPSLRSTLGVPLSKREDRFDNKFAKRLFEEVRKVAHSNTRPNRVLQILKDIKIGTSNQMLVAMRNVTSGTNTWNEKLRKLDEEDPSFELLRDLAVANAFLPFYEECEYYVLQFARNINYIAPLRASAERYYRLQGLAVNEVDYQGQNLAMFLRNLSDGDRSKFNEWMANNLGFVAETRFDGGHLSLFLSETDSEQVFNLADMGFGFSQLLPVVTQLWLSSTSRYIMAPRLRNVPVTITIEQPELHLHPRLQARLADVFSSTIRAAKQSRIDLRIIIETHSQTMVNRFGNRIASGDLDPQDINVVLFEKLIGNSESSIRISQFDNDGFLTNWPFGFFEPDNI